MEGDPDPKLSCPPESNDTSTKPKPITPMLKMYNLGAQGDEISSNGGSGTAEILDVIRHLKKAGISSCVVGTLPLRYYGTGRIPVVTEICVPEEQLTEAAELFKSEPLCQQYETWPVNDPILHSLLHIYPRFHLKGVHFVFSLVSSADWLIDCDESKCELSWMGLPYPKLEYFAQSLLYTQRWTDLHDLIDGMDLSEEWGEEHLKFDQAPSDQFAEWKNERIRATVPKTRWSIMMEISLPAPELKPIWLRFVRTKKERIPIELDPKRWLTRYFLIGDDDPRSEQRTWC
ncbi:hypothetical protein F5Y16DRAFT_403562 [Xylariaceae sp. FL0255]|nr:hypothetical protein F5Y16DRAFT_403562 [Xylariaceae sp. FL0255]